MAAPEKKGIKRFVLVSEKKFTYYQEIINFKLSKDNKYDFQKIKIEKYKGITTSSKGKKLISEIDNLTLSYSSEEEFLRFLGYYEPLHKFFIGFSSKGRIKNINPVFNNPELQSRLKLVKEDKLHDVSIIIEKKELVDKLLEKNSKLYKIYSQDKYYKSATLKNALENIKKIDSSDPDASTVRFSIKGEILDEFNKYYLYRGLFLAYQEYCRTYKDIDCQQKLPTVEETDNTEIKVKTNKIELKPLEGEQLRFK